METKSIASQQNLLEKELERYLKLYSQDPKSRSFAPLGETYRKMGKLDEAINILEEGVKIHSNYASGHISLGRCYGDKGDSKRAISEYETAIKYSPDNIMAFRLLAKEYSTMGDDNALKEIYTKLLRIVPNDEESKGFLVSKGFLKIEEQPKKEIKLPPKVEVKSDEPKLAQSNSLEFYTMTLADIYLKQGLKEKAQEIYRVLLKYNPSNKVYKDALSRINGDEAEKIKLPEMKPVLLAVTPAVFENIVDSKVNKLQSILNIIGMKKRSA